MKKAHVALKEAIAKSGYKERAVAEKIGMSPGEFYRVLGGRRKLNVDEFFAVCEAIGVDVVKLCDHIKRTA